MLRLRSYNRFRRSYKLCCYRLLRFCLELVYNQLVCCLLGRLVSWQGGAILTVSDVDVLLVASGHDSNVFAVGRPQGQELVEPL